MKQCIRTRFMLIPGSCYRVNFNGQEKELVFEGRTNQLGVGLLKWHDQKGKPFLSRVNDQSIVVIHSFT
ncbi:MAG: hypothetical protein MI976_11340 [Pseudomonadales bacterium]|nr:hypothetical protein [Pseudomonadales bacterium]